jgi:hypothetical protein
MDIINEQTDCILTINFLDENRQPVVPDSVTYNIKTFSGDSIVADTTVSPGDSYYNLPITAFQNRIIHTQNYLEQRVVAMKFVYAASTKQGTSNYFYSVQKLLNV